MFEQVGPALRLSLVTFVLCGIAYPLAMTGIAQAAFPHQANGSLIQAADGTLVGSELIGQKFTGPEWFHGRSSSIDYKAEASGASNYGPTNKALFDRVASESKVVRAENPTLGNRPIPVDLLTTSGSGLDPHITPASALLQVPRVARARGLTEDKVRRLVEANTDRPDLGLFGESRVNVLKLNLSLAAAAMSARSSER
jgi:K+-transporting ATPase ATPase C chain